MKNTKSNRPMSWLRYGTVTTVTGVSVLTPYAGAYRNYAEGEVTGVTPVAWGGKRAGVGALVP